MKKMMVTVKKKLKSPEKEKKDSSVKIESEEVISG